MCMSSKTSQGAIRKWTYRFFAERTSGLSVSTFQDTKLRNTSQGVPHGPIPLRGTHVAFPILSLLIHANTHSLDQRRPGSHQPPFTAGREDHLCFQCGPPSG